MNSRRHEHTLHFLDPRGGPVDVTFALAGHRITSTRSVAGEPITQPLYMTTEAVSRVIDYLRDLLDGGEASTHTLWCIGPTGKPLYVLFAAEADGRISVRRSTGGGGVLYMLPPLIELMIRYLRDLQSQAMQGETWTAE